MTRPVYCLLCALTILSAVPALGSSDVEDRFARLDENGDGAVSWAEAYQVRAGEFLKMDTSLDGRVEASEFGGRALPLSDFDRNSNRKLELSEYLGQHHRMFDKFDADESGTIELEEFKEAQKAVRDQ